MLGDFTYRPSRESTKAMPRPSSPWHSAQPRDSERYFPDFAAARSLAYGTGTTRISTLRFSLRSPSHAAPAKPAEARIARTTNAMPPRFRIFLNMGHDTGRDAIPLRSSALGLGAAMGELDPPGRRRARRGGGIGAARAAPCSHGLRSRRGGSRQEPFLGSSAARGAPRGGPRGGAVALCGTALRRHRRDQLPASPAAARIGRRAGTRRHAHLRNLRRGQRALRQALQSGLPARARRADRGGARQAAGDRLRG